MTSILSQSKRVFNATNSNPIFWKSKKSAELFSAFPKSTSNLEYFEKEDEPRKSFFFWKYRLQKTGLLKCPCVRTLMNSEYVKVSNTLHKPAPQYFCHISWWLCTEIWSKKIVSVVSEILRLFVDILPPNDKYSVSVKASVWRNQFNCYYLIIKKIFFHFFWISEIYLKFEILSKKWWASENIFLWNHRLQKAELLKCLKRPVSAHLWTVNMLKWAKDCLDLHVSIFVIFFDHPESKSATKNLFS